MAKQQRPLDLALAKLQESGLDAGDMRSLEMEVLEPRATAKLARGFHALPSLLIPYHTAAGKRAPFFRARYLANPPTTFGQKKPLRYVQPPGSGVAAYLPRTIPWSAVIGDPTVEIYVTEGELKAAAGAKAGLAVIGLGGVFNFQAARDGVAFLPELEAVDWRRRPVFVVFDSDLASKPQVTVALNRLVGRLVERGAMARVVSLPTLPGQAKTGLDDFLVAQGADAFAELVEEARDDQLAIELWRLNEELVYVMDPGLVVNIETGQRMSPFGFQTHHYANRTFDEVRVSANGARSVRKVQVAEEWLAWPHRTQRHSITYKPGAPAVTDDAYNTWRAGPEPAEGDVEPWRKLLDHLFVGAEPEARRWFERWCAFPVQYPGTKLFTCAVLWGVAHGTGKSLVGYSLGAVYGKHNFSELSEIDLFRTNFNEWAQGKQFALGDDITGDDRRATAGFLKKLVTQETVRINAKHLPTYVVPDCLNYLFTSQQPDAVFLDDRDRRFFVHEVTVDPQPEGFYVDYDAWLHSEVGPAALAWYLHRVDLEGFNPAAAAPVTNAKRRMTDVARSDVGSWVARLREAPDDVLRVGRAAAPLDVYTPRELLAIYDPTGQTRTTANGLGRAMAAAGFRQVCDGRPVRLNGVLDRYYAVRNAGRWLRASVEALTAHVGSAHEAPGGKRKF